MNVNDSVKSKTLKPAFKTPEIINNHKVEGESKNIFGRLDLPSNNDSSGEKENNKSNINNSNADMIESNKNIFILVGFKIKLFY